MIVLHARFPIDPDKRSQAQDVIEDIVQGSRAEDGVLEYQATTEIDDENVFRFFERYEDEASLEAHTQTDHYQEFESKIGDLLSGEPEAIRYDVESVTEIEL